SCFSLLTHSPPHSPLFPYTTLFRSLETPDFGDESRRETVATVRFHTGDRVVDRASAGLVAETTIPFQMPAQDLHGLPPQIVSGRSEEHTSELQSLRHLVCRLLLEKK